MIDLGALELVDHHCHSVVTGRLGRDRFESMLGEAALPPPPGCSAADSSLGLAVRAWCAPVLGLSAGAPMEAYVERRAGLDDVEVRLMGGLSVATMLVDTGYRSDELAPLAALATWTGAEVREIVRLESLAEQARDAGGDYVWAFERLVGESAGRAAGWKSVAAYRCGLDIDWRRPGPDEVRAAALDWRQGRLEDPVLIRHGVWAALDTGLPLQLHTGYGDPDIRLATASPAHLEDLLRHSVELATPVVMLHCWPWHRQAAYLTQVWPHAHMDVGLALPHVGHHGHRVLAEALELAPWHKVLYSSDAFGLAELHHLGARVWRQALGAALEPLEAMGFDDAELGRLARLACSGNARRIYGLEAAGRTGPGPDTGPGTDMGPGTDTGSGRDTAPGTHTA